jgi:Domain of unknown function (DUF6134)
MQLLMNLRFAGAAKLAAAILVSLAFGANAAPGASTETLRFAIMRNGDQIGTHTVEISRGPKETSVNMSTDLTVKVMFITAYYLQYTTSERWVGGKLVALNSASDDNGTKHKVSAALKGNGLEVEADGKTTTVDKNIMPATLWNHEVVKRTQVLDPKDGEVVPITVTDQGVEDLTIDGRTIKARHYVLKGKFPQDVWYDEKGRLVQSSLVAPDGSVILYKPM